VNADGVTLPGVNPDVPHVARIYDYFLGGQDNYPADHATAGNMNAGDLAEAVQTYASSSAGSITLRSPEQIAAFFSGLELEEPGVVPAAQWRPGTAAPPAIYGPTFLGGLARETASPR
jgi:S-adenosyl methyltransferase